MDTRRTRELLEDRAHCALWCAIDVGSLKVPVYLVDRAAFSFMKGNAGYFESTICTIFVDWDLPEDVAEHTLFHELGHAECYAFGVSLDGEKPNTEDAEEVFVDRQGVRFDTLRRNGWIRFPPRPAIPRAA